MSSSYLITACEGGHRANYPTRHFPTNPRLRCDSLRLFISLVLAVAAFLHGDHIGKLFASRRIPPLPTKSVTFRNAPSWAQWFALKALSLDEILFLVACVRGEKIV